MPKINFPKGNAWKEFELETELITPNVINLELKPSLKKDSTKALLKEIKIKKEELEKKGSELEKDVVSRELLSYFDFAVNFAMSLVVGWDLTDEKDKVIPCNDKNKAMFLEDLVWEKVVQEETEEDDEEVKNKVPWLFFEIIKFCSNIGNFSKN